MKAIIINGHRYKSVKIAANENGLSVNALTMIVNKRGMIGEKCFSYNGHKVIIPDEKKEEPVKELAKKIRPEPVIHVQLKGSSYAEKDMIERVNRVSDTLNDYLAILEDLDVQAEKIRGQVEKLRIEIERA